MEGMTKNMPEFQELTETFTADGLEEDLEEVRDKAYLTIHRVSINIVFYGSPK